MKILIADDEKDAADFAAKELGADEYLTKPFKAKDIIDIIDKYRGTKDG